MKELKHLIGIPFKDKDCYHLTREAYKIMHGFDMIDTTIYHNECELVYQVFLDERVKWHKVEKQKGVIVAIRLNPYFPKTVTHFGIMIDDNNMLHTTYETGSVIENISKYNKLIEGFYSHKNI